MGFLEINNVTKSYGAVKVLHDIDIDVDEGEFLVLVGPSGCGKSTLLNIIAGLENLTSGEIAINDQTVNHIHPSNRNIAMVFQSYALYPNMTVAQNITFGLEMHNVPKAEREAALNDVAKLLQIEPLLNRKPGQLSGGQRQRVAMGRALVRNPDVFLFDEPLSNLDAKLRVDMRTEIKKLHQKLKKTIVYVTHDQIEAMTLSSRIAVMYNGYVQQLGTPSEVYNKPANVFVAKFIGSPAMNVIPATISIKAKQAFACFEDGNGKAIELQLSQPVSSLKDGQSLLLGIRPEAISDLGNEDRNVNISKPFETTVMVTEPSGADTFVTLNLAGHDVVSRLRGDVALPSGTLASFTVNMDKVVLFDPETENRLDIG